MLFRSVGESQWLEGEVDLSAVASGDTSSAVYTLGDMADDAVGLLDALGLASAHVVGASLGGMIAQTVAIRHPQRVRSLTSIMSTTGEPGAANPTEEAAAVARPPETGMRGSSSPCTTSVGTSIDLSPSVRSPDTYTAAS